MASTEVSLTGVRRRKSTGPYYFEARIPGHGKLYCRKIKSLEEGALCYDILQRYIELGVIGKKSKAAVELNYPEYSKTLQLEPLRSDFDIQIHKEEAMEIILKQAQAAAKNLRESLRRPTPVVGSLSPSNRSSSHQNVHGNPPVAKQDLPGILQKISDLDLHCKMEYASIVIEREMLERKVEDITEDSGHIYFPKPLPNEITDFMARLEQLTAIDEKIPGMAEQDYQSEVSKCLELRHLLEDHNRAVFDEIFMENDKDSLGRQRANEDERLPLLEDCPSKEQNERGVSVLDSDGYGPPGTPPVDVCSLGTDTTTPPAEIGVSQRAVTHDFGPLPPVENRWDQDWFSDIY